MQQDHIKINRLNVNLSKLDNAEAFCCHDVNSILIDPALMACMKKFREFARSISLKMMSMIRATRPLKMAINQAKKALHESRQATKWMRMQMP
jgi:hypothetical protein